MRKAGKPATLAGIGVLAASGILLLRAADSQTNQQLGVAHAECTFFGAKREAFVDASLAGHPGASRRALTLSPVTDQVASALSYVPGGSRTNTFQVDHQPGTIDSYIFADFQANGIQPSDKTSDWEFIRRVTLDLTGRIPKPDRVLSFVADQTPNKRAALVDELLASPQWVDKWTMYFGDLYKNTVTRPSSGVVRFAQGRNAFYQYIKSSLAANKGYNQMASELVSAQGDSSYDKGELNWLVGGIVGGGPQQDITDQQAANVAETFLGLAHVNCLLCHNGRGHLDALSMWGSQTTRYQAWQFASFLSHTQTARVQYDPNNRNVYYWSVQDNTKGFTNDYTLNTTTGNRPARQATSGCKSGQPCYYVPPAYLNGQAPNPGESYRVALARFVTSDFQFARATVNYMWAQFFGRGIVDPPNTFDPARLDPDNPPPDPWTLQPSNARLLNALAQRFIDGGYNLKSLMRDIANSDTYQLSTRYNGNWNPAWEKYFARKFVRRLWAEEIHDAVVQSSGSIPTYNIGALGSVSYAMQFPDTVNMPGGSVNTFLDNFLRGNRDDNDRKPEGSVLQALGLMNDTFVTNRLQNPMLAGLLQKSDQELVSSLFLNVLSRYPTDSENNTALGALKTGNRTQAAMDLLWSLYNKVDFVFNY